VPPHGGSHVNHKALRRFVAECSACEHSKLEITDCDFKLQCPQGRRSASDAHMQKKFMLKNKRSAIAD
jgi:hypothetical protein